MKNIGLKPLIIATAMGLPSFAFAAEGLSYTYVELDYLVQDVDLYEDDGVFDEFVEDTDDGDGFELKGSFAFTDALFGFASYSNTSSDFTYRDNVGNLYPENEDIKTLTLGLGYFAPLNDQMDIVARAAYMDLDYGEFSLGGSDDDIGSGDDGIDDDLQNALDDLNEDSSDGYFVDLGLRSQIVDWLELGGGVRYTDLDVNDDFSVFGNALFEINQNVGINLGVDIGDSLSTYQIGVRYSI